MIRLIVATSFLFVSVAFIGGGFWLGATTPTGGLLTNLGTEVFGILVTVAVVEWLFERRRLQDKARELAWSILHSLERSVWIWQGGPERVGTDELLGIIAGIRSSDTISRFTKVLLVNLGTQSREALDKDPKAVRSLAGLKLSLEDLSSLRSLRDGDSAVSVRMISEILEAGATGLARLLGKPTQRLPSGLIRGRDSSEKAQEERRFDLGATPPAIPDRTPELPPSRGPTPDPTPDRA
ncbi:MAG: hypothetical protein BMS9Abin29_1610 [Gemmatimonadota bacterium]|nr:MAG: hypothetical protein BMS9Abin29_1610 [Gemmatimonadota bacterium]